MRFTLFGIAAAVMLTTVTLVAGPPVPLPNGNQSLMFTGTISPASQDLQFHELLFQATDASNNSVAGAGTLSGTCLVSNAPCQFSATAGYAAPPTFAPVTIAYTILGFYGTDPTYGPQSGDISGGVVVSNPNVFAVTNTIFPDFTTFFPGNFGSLTGEDAIATVFYNGGGIAADGIEPTVFANVPLLAAGGPLTGGVIEDFSGTKNGTVSIQVSSGSVPEPGYLAMLGLFVLLCICRQHRSQLS